MVGRVEGVRGGVKKKWYFWVVGAVWGGGFEAQPQKIVPNFFFVPFISEKYY